MPNETIVAEYVRADVSLFFEPEHIACQYCPFWNGIAATNADAQGNISLTRGSPLVGSAL